MGCQCTPQGATYWKLGAQSVVLAGTAGTLKRWSLGEVGTGPTQCLASCQAVSSLCGTCASATVMPPPGGLQHSRAAASATPLSLQKCEPHRLASLQRSAQLPCVTATLPWLPATRDSETQSHGWKLQLGHLRTGSWTERPAGASPGALRGRS